MCVLAPSITADKLWATLLEPLRLRKHGLYPQIAGEYGRCVGVIMAKLDHASPAQQAVGLQLTQAGPAVAAGAGGLALEGATQQLKEALMQLDFDRCHEQLLHFLDGASGGKRVGAGAATSAYSAAPAPRHAWPKVVELMYRQVLRVLPTLQPKLRLRALEVLRRHSRFLYENGVLAELSAAPDLYKATVGELEQPVVQVGSLSGYLMTFAVG